MTTTCENCHFQEAQFQNNPTHVKLQIPCMTCHMPKTIQNAWANPDSYMGDVRSHVMSIAPYQVNQFNPDGSLATNQISLDFACRQCHNASTGLSKTDDQLMQAATGYHARPQTK